MTRRRSPALWASVGFLLVEGGALVVGRGNCPVGRLQESWGDPVPFFELLLPPRAAKAAVPVLAAVSLVAWALAQTLLRFCSRAYLQAIHVAVWVALYAVYFVRLSD